MIIESTTSGKISVFQRMPGSNNRKVGFICEAGSVAEAKSGVVQLVAKHCTTTGMHPAQIIDGKESR